MKLFVWNMLAMMASFCAAVTEETTKVESNEEKPDACVSLLIHPDSRCNEEAVKIITFPTWTESEKSPCYTNDKLMVSISNQYCNAKTGNWHQTLYPKDGDCREVPWWLSWIFPLEQVFTPDGCVLGFDELGAVGMSLKSCAAGPCDESSILLDDDKSSIFSLTRNLRA